MIERLSGVRVLVVGDRMTDVDVHGVCTRFAQEAAGCPVFTEVHRESRPGGAGAVAEMCKALGATVDLVAGPPSIKTRYLVAGRQLWRHDRDAGPVDQPTLSGMLARIDAASVDAVLVADHGKGACTRAVLKAALARGVPVIIDPAKGSGWEEYRGATAIKCNAPEWGAVYELPHHDNGGWWEPLTENVIVTAGPDGMTHYPRRQSATSYPTTPRPAVDVTGCGDMVLAVLGCCAAAGIDWPDACRLANLAAGLKVMRHGAVPVTAADLAVAGG